MIFAEDAGGEGEEIMRPDSQWVESSTVKWINKYQLNNEGEIKYG
jgi:hypothetical protein